MYRALLFIAFTFSVCMVQAADEAITPAELFQSWLKESDEAKRAVLLERIKKLPQSFDELQKTYFKVLTDGRSKFEQGVHKFDFQNDEINGYLVLVPKGYAPEKSWPVILAFHPAMTSAENWLQRWEKSCGEFLLVCPRGRAQMGWTLGPLHLPCIPPLLDSLNTKFKIDHNRVYITGHSMGGHLTWNLATLYPDLFAAAAPTASRPVYFKYLDNLLKIPIRVAQGQDDKIVPLADNQKAAEEIKQKGGNIELVILENQGHAFVSGQQGKIVEFFKKNQRKNNPTEISYLTTTPPFDRHFWISLDQITRENKFSKVRAKQDKNSVTIDCEEIQKLTVYFNEESVDISKPVTISVNGKKVFSGMIKKDIGIFLENTLNGRSGFEYCAAVQIAVPKTENKGEVDPGK